MGYKELLDEFNGKSIIVNTVDGKEISGALDLVRDTHVKLKSGRDTYFIQMDKIIAFRPV